LFALLVWQVPASFWKLLHGRTWLAIEFLRLRGLVLVAM
jgi:hypothetical protein